MEDMVISGMRLTPNGSGAAMGGQNASVTIRRSTFLNNGAVDGSAGAILISSTTTVVIEDSTFENNFANGSSGAGNGGAISLGNGGNLTIRRSTFSGNTAGDRGGAVAMFAANAVLNIENSTFANNTATNSGGALDINAGTANISNSLFAGNEISGTPAGDPTININLSGVGVINTLGYNAVTDNSGAVIDFPDGQPNVNNDYVGTALTPFNARIETLADNGGPTRTHALQSNSTLIDAGSCTGELRDQRGYSNPGGGRIVDFPGTTNADDGCDVGAYERGAQPPVLDFADGFEDPPID
jgi:predicted outer membrane repeat protein